jgi:hypothetical protein
VPFELPMLVKEVGYYTAIGMVVAWFVWKLFIKRALIDLIDERRAATRYAILVGESIRNPKHDKNDPTSREIISRHEINENILNLREMIEDRCGNVSCPVIPIVANQMKENDRKLAEYDQKIDEYIRETKAVRANMVQWMEDIQKELGDIHKRLSDFIAGLATEMVAAIRTGTWAKKNGKE